MARFEPIPSSDLNEEQRSLEEIAINILPQGNSIFTWRDDATGALLGPFTAFLRFPQVARALVAFQTTVAQTGSSAHPPLSPECREIAILTVGAKFKAGYELYSHERIATAETALTKEQVEALSAGRKPQGLDETGDVAWEVTETLVNKPGPLESELWGKSVKILGKNATFALINFVGLYCYISIVVNGFDVPVPED